MRTREGSHVYSTVFVMSQKAKENILRRIQQSLETPTTRPMPKPDFSAPIYAPTGQETAIEFVERFKKNNGQFYYCETQAELLQQLPALIQQKQLEHVYAWEENLVAMLSTTGIPFRWNDEQFLKADTGITFCECLIARTGSIMVSSKQASGRRLTIYPHVHIVVAYTSQILPDIKDGLALVQERYGQRMPSMLSMITGPSRTADIEKTLVLGAHGPKELVLFLVEG